MDHTKYSSDDIPFVVADPAFNAAVYTPMLHKPTERVHSIDEFQSAEEIQQWMEVKHAASVLGIAKEDIPVLNAGKIERQWAHYFRAAKNSPVQQVTVNRAAEMLLQYVDSGMNITQSRGHYSNIISRARHALLNDMEEERKVLHQTFYKGVALLAVTMTIGLIGACIFAVFRSRDPKDVFKPALNYTVEYVKVFTRKPAEPAPDYSSRAMRTPTQIDVDAAAGYIPLEINRVYRDAEQKLILSHEAEDALTLQLLNEEAERMRQQSANDAQAMSSVVILLENEATAAEKAQAANAAAQAAQEAAAAEAAASWGFVSAMKAVGDRLENVIDHLPSAPSAGGTIEGRARDAYADRVDQRLRDRAKKAAEAEGADVAAVMPDEASNGSAPGLFQAPSLPSSSES